MSRHWLLSVVMAVLCSVCSGEVGVANEVTSTAKPSLAENNVTSRTDLPILFNHIYDTFSSKHTHHNQRNGPHFESTPNVTNITVQVGSDASMDCHVSLLQDKSVNWMFRQSGNETLRLLTLGNTTYSADPRHSVGFVYPTNWRLTVSNVRPEDEGTYQCQISTHPPMIIRIHLTVNVPQVVIVDEQGAPIQDKHYESSSTIWLSCIVRHVRMTGSVVSWIHAGKLLNQDSTRGGISVKTELKENGAFSNLSVARVDKQDSGNYTCAISDTELTTVTVHVLDGESRLAELHHGAGTRRHAAHLLIGLAAMFVHRLFPL